MAANAPPQQGPALQHDASHHSSYRALYADAACDPMYHRPGGYLTGYRFVADANGVAAPAPATLCDQTVFLCDCQPMAFLALVARPDGAHEVSILHRLMQYLDFPGEAATGYHDRVLALLGEVRLMQFPLVEESTSAFHLATAAVRVPTVVAMAQQLGQQGGAQLQLSRTWTVIQILKSSDPATCNCCQDGMQLSSLDARESPLAYAELSAVISADGFDVQCADVLTWFRAACTSRGGVGAQAAEPIVLHHCVPQQVPQPVLEYVMAKINADLPGLSAGAAAPPPPMDNFALQVARALGGRIPVEDLTNKLPRSVREAYKETFPLLLRCTREDSLDNLAPLWSRLANCHKSKQISILQHEFAKVCVARDLAPVLYCPVVTTGLKQMVLSLNFAGIGADDLTAGLNPFLVSYSGSHDYYAAQAVAKIAAQLDQGAQAASLTDIQALKEREKIKFPRNLNQVSISLS